MTMKQTIFESPMIKVKLVDYRDNIADILDDKLHIRIENITRQYFIKGVITNGIV